MSTRLGPFGASLVAACPEFIEGATSRRGPEAGGGADVPLAQAGQAISYFGKGHAMGKVVIGG